ncbi:MAG TPA: hypothetical protein VGF99_10480 [Myxococcota bacterium]
MIMPPSPLSLPTPPDTSALRTRLDALLREHAAIKARVADFQKRLWLSAGEQLELKTLQRLKLQKKDAITAVEAELTAAELTFLLD